MAAGVRPRPLAVLLAARAPRLDRALISLPISTVPTLNTVRFEALDNRLKATG